MKNGIIILICCWFCQVSTQKRAEDHQNDYAAGHLLGSNVDPILDHSHHERLRLFPPHITYGVDDTRYHRQGLLHRQPDLVRRQPQGGQVGDGQEVGILSYFLSPPASASSHLQAQAFFHWEAHRAGDHEGQRCPHQQLSLDTFPTAELYPKSFESFPCALRLFDVFQVIFWDLWYTTRPAMT